jgi:hypothetical protein
MSKHEVITMDFAIVERLRAIHGSKLSLYRDKELLDAYNKYFNSPYFTGIDNKNFLLFIW